MLMGLVLLGFVACDGPSTPPFFSCLAELFVHHSLFPTRPVSQILICLQVSYPLSCSLQLEQ